MFSRERLLTRARSIRHLRSSCASADDAQLPPPVPALPRGLAGLGYSASVAVNMPLPPTQRPSTSAASTSPRSSDYCRFHRRDVSSCSHVSRASSSWSSASSTSSASSRSSSTSSSRLEYDPLRLHPSTMAVGYSPVCYRDDGFASFDFGFHEPAAATTTTYSSSDLDDTFATGLSPPPSHHRLLRAPCSELTLRRPSTPIDMPALPSSEPASPVRPRMLPDESVGVERFLKRGDWKRRGIVFGAADY